MTLVVFIMVNYIIIRFLKLKKCLKIILKWNYPWIKAMKKAKKGYAYAKNETE